MEAWCLPLRNSYPARTGSFVLKCKSDEKWFRRGLYLKSFITKRVVKLWLPRKAVDSPLQELFERHVDMPLTDMV